jgi:hypothetical protein
LISTAFDASEGGKNVQKCPKIKLDSEAFGEMSEEMVKESVKVAPIICANL